MKFKYDRQLILSTVFCTFPMFLTFFLYDSLPEMIPVHFTFNGTPNSFAQKAFVGYGIPAILMIINFFTHLLINNDPKKISQPKTFIIIIKYLIPFISLILVSSSLLISLGFYVSLGSLIPIFIGVLFIIIGRYLPKIKRNYTIGFKLPWTLDNDENFKKTNTLTGFIFMISGILILCSTILNPNFLYILFIIVILSILLIPTIYSYTLYKKQNNNK